MKCFIGQYCIWHTDRSPAPRLITRAQDDKVVWRWDVAKPFGTRIEIGPIYNRLPDRVRAHAAICFMALIMNRVMRARLRAGKTGLSPERAVETLRRIQHHRITLNSTQPVSGVSTISIEQTSILAALTIKKPTLPAQLPLL